MMTKYRCRNDFVLFRLVNRGQIRGLAIPDRAAEGKERVVVATGPDVKGLEPGDRILVIGTIGQDTIPLPNERDLYLTKQANVALVDVTDYPPKSIPCSPEEAG